MLNYQEHLAEYKLLHSRECELGYIVWRFGPGELVHIVHLAASEHRKGYGRRLVFELLKSLDHEKVHTVCGFTRERLIKAQVFYKAIGFNLIKLPGLYREGNGVIFTQSLSKLLEINSNAYNENLVS